MDTFSDHSKVNFFSFYFLFKSECAKVRRQKELELEVLTGVIRDWEGDEKVCRLHHSFLWQIQKAKLFYQMEERNHIC